jgi:Protein of unknown function (DUF3999)
MKYTKTIALLLVVHQVLAQKFEATAAITNIKTDGLYRLLLTPQIRSYAKADRRDLRVYDAAGEEVPYFVSTVANKTSSTDFDEYEIVAKNIVPQRSTTLVIAHTKDEKISTIGLNIANSDLAKTCNISGSNDQKQWFGLIDKYLLLDLKDDKNTSVFKVIDLPLSSYRYLKIDIDDKKTAPINVLKVGNFRSSVFGVSTQVLMPQKRHIAIDERRKKTVITLSFDRPQAIDKVDFKITQPNLYQRYAQLIVNRNQKKHRRLKKNEVDLLANFELKSGQSNSFDLPALFEKELIIEIDNGDNPPLTIDDIQLRQLPSYLVADFKASKRYTIRAGNDALTAPDYDISHFRAQISKDLPQATIADIQTQVVATKNDQPSHFWQQSWFLWLCIGIVALSIVYFSSSLLSDMKK